MFRTKALLGVLFVVSAASISNAANIIYVDVNGPNTPGTGSYEDPFRRIQYAIDAATGGDIIEIHPGLYTGPGNYNLDPNGLAITIRSTDPNDPNVVAVTIIDPNGAGRGFYFHSGEDANSVLNGFTITNGYADYGGGVYCVLASPMVTNCIITGNSAQFYGGGINCISASPAIINCTISSNSAHYGGGGLRSCDGSITNCTIAGNSTDYDGSVGGGLSYCDGAIRNCTISGNTAGGDGGGLAYCNGSITSCTITGNSTDEAGGGLYNCGGPISNCIFVNNTKQAIYERDLSPTVTYCSFYNNTDGDWYDHDTSSTLTGAAAINALPEASNNIDADPCFVTFDPNADPNMWDFHLQSASGRWDPNNQTWVMDSDTSPCIDVGDPNSDWSNEAWPNGKRINMGTYGGTIQASKKGNIADFDVSGAVNFWDFAYFGDNWQSEEILLPEDLNRDGRVGLTDLAIFANKWLWQGE